MDRYPEPINKLSQWVGLSRKEEAADLMSMEVNGIMIS